MIFFAVWGIADTEKQGYTDLKCTASAHRCTSLLYVCTKTQKLRPPECWWGKYRNWKSAFFPPKLARIWKWNPQSPSAKKQALIWCEIFIRGEFHTWAALCWLNINVWTFPHFKSISLSFSWSDSFKKLLSTSKDTNLPKTSTKKRSPEDIKHTKIIYRVLQLHHVRL